MGAGQFERRYALCCERARLETSAVAKLQVPGWTWALKSAPVHGIVVEQER